MRATLCAPSSTRAAPRLRARPAACRAAARPSDAAPAPSPVGVLPPAAALWLATAAPSLAADAAATGGGGFAKESYYVTLGLFLMSLPGLWSQIKRAPKAKRVRRVYEVAVGPASPGAPPLDDTARAVYRHFTALNYRVTGSGDVIRFVGRYAASKGQAAALVFYVFCGLASTALVLSIAAPFGGNAWYGLTALSPLAGVYYWQRGERDEEVAVKMVVADDDASADITVEGDVEEVERLAKALGLMEKGKVYVKGLLEV